MEMAVEVCRRLDRAHDAVDWHRRLPGLDEGARVPGARPAAPGRGGTSPDDERYLA
jgi:hypothetical protein